MKKTFKRSLSVLLAAVMLLSFTALGSANAADSGEAASAVSAPQSYGLPETIQEGAILHCWCWSYNTIKDNLPQIAAAGFKTVQTSPVQRPKDYSVSYKDISGQWWKLYQPLGLSVAGSNTSWIGSKEELTALCTEADKYGIKVVVDIVANHLANKNSAGGGFSNVNTNVDADLYNAAYFHSNTAGMTGVTTRYGITQNHLGMPDLNTGNEYVQSKVVSLINECLECGVDGFRYDAAKHIELPDDQPYNGNNFASDFWTLVLDNNSEFQYGEILPGADRIEDYAKIMKVTAANYGSNLRQAIINKKLTTTAIKNNRMINIDNTQAVMWVESHDNYTDDGTWSALNNDQINLGWAVIAAQGDSTPLFFARPKGSSTTSQWGSNKMGQAGDGNYYSQTVSAVNHFRNAMVGESKNVVEIVKQKVQMIERGTKGAVLVSLSDDVTNVNVSTNLEAGEYTDRISGETFTVANGKLTGKVGASAVVVLYNDAEEVLVGDVNNNGEIDIDDATTLQRHLAKFTLAGGAPIIDETDPKQFMVADVDKDGDITILDVTVIQQMLARFI